MSSQLGEAGLRASLSADPLSQQPKRHYLVLGFRGSYTRNVIKQIISLSRFHEAPPPPTGSQDLPTGLGSQSPNSGSRSKTQKASVALLVRILGFEELWVAEVRVLPKDESREPASKRSLSHLAKDRGRTSVNLVLTEAPDFHIEVRILCGARCSRPGGTLSAGGPSVASRRPRDGTTLMLVMFTLSSGTCAERERERDKQRERERKREIKNRKRHLFCICIDFGIHVCWNV